MYKTFIRPLLFRMNPERAHAFTFSCLKALQKMPFGLALASLFFRKKDPRLEREVFGIKFPSPVGVAAGLDKDAEVPDALGALPGVHLKNVGQEIQVLDAGKIIIQIRIVRHISQYLFAQ